MHQTSAQQEALPGKKPRYGYPIKQPLPETVQNEENIERRENSILKSARTSAARTAAEKTPCKVADVNGNVVEGLNQKSILGDNIRYSEKGPFGYVRTSPKEGDRVKELSLDPPRVTKHKREVYAMEESQRRRNLHEVLGVRLLQLPSDNSNTIYHYAPLEAHDDTPGFLPAGASGVSYHAYTWPIVGVVIIICLLAAWVVRRNLNNN